MRLENARYNAQEVLQARESGDHKESRRLYGNMCIVFGVRASDEALAYVAERRGVSDISDLIAELNEQRRQPIVQLH